MTRKERYRAFVAHFVVHMPEATTELRYESPFELLCAVILSAQCTDKRINQVTPLLFAHFPTAAVLAAARAQDIAHYIRSVSYPRAKARYLVEMARMLVEEFGGEVPQQVAALQRLPGVGRKTAHVIVSVLYGQPAMAVDTHVMRVSRRLGLLSAEAKTPLAIEKELVAGLPRQHVAQAHHWLILHGRYTCLARRPRCASCPLASFCASYPLEPPRRR